MIIKTETEDTVEARMVCDRCLDEIKLIFRYKGNKQKLWDVNNPFTNIHDTVENGLSIDTTHKHYHGKCIKKYTDMQKVLKSLYGKGVVEA